MEKGIVQIEGTTLERDVHSKGLRETNINRALEYKARRATLKQKFDDKDEKIASLEEQIASLWEAINSLKSRTT